MAAGASVPVIYLAHDPGTADIPGMLNTTLLGVAVLGGIGLIGIAGFIRLMQKTPTTNLNDVGGPKAAVG